MSEPAYVSVNGTKVDGSMVFLPLRIAHGRSTPDTQPDSPVAEFSTWGPTPVCAKGDDLTVTAFGPATGTPTVWADPTQTWTQPSRSWTGTPIVEFRRFTGTVTSVKAVEEDGDVVQWDVRAIGTQAALGLEPVRIDRPQETDTARVAAIASAAGVTVQIVGDPSLTLAADSINQSALGAIQEVCLWTGSLFWQDKDGGFIYGTSNHRAGISGVTLPAQSILDGIEWSSDVAQVLNHITVEFPDPPGQGQGNAGGQGQGQGGVVIQQQDTYEDAASIAQWGRRHADIATKCADDQEAGILALTVLARRAQPFWTMPGVIIPMDDVSAAQTAAVNSLEVSTGVLVPVPTAPGATPAPVDQWAVEGWVEEFRDDGRWLQLALSDWARFSAAILRTYAVVRDTLTYQQAAAKTYQQLLAEVV